MAKTEPTATKSFGSDNHSGAHPDILAALVAANVGHTPSYGQDPWTERAEAIFRRHFGDVETHFVFNGTAANVLSIGALIRPHQSILCSDVSHLAVDECGAPERLLGSKLITLPHQHGKISVADLERRLIRGGDQHFSQPRVVSLTQPTELGTVYSLGELREIISFAHAHDLVVHMDGARLVNAAVSLDVSLAEICQGVDVLSFGGTKNGLVFGEAVVLFNEAARREFRFQRKQAMQLASKSRFIAAQFEALLGGELWKTNARHALGMAQRLEAAVRRLPGIDITQPVQSNAVFARLPWPAIKRARERYFFYVWDEHQGEVRWMCSFDTTAADVDGFAQVLAEAVA